MPLTKTEKQAIERVRRPGGATLAVKLDDAVCAGLVGLISHDLGLDLAPEPAPYFTADPRSVRLAGVPFWPLMEKACERDREVVTYFACLAKLHKTRLKYANILRAQAIPTMDQVGPRGLLQFGWMSPKALTSLLLWRKWIFDLDNRAAQETGYLFEPIIANSIGGVPGHGSNSPISRHNDKTKTRQVDCIAEMTAYEIKMRVTIAASNQGRWNEQLEFPIDCRSSGYTPILIVFDPTPDDKFDTLRLAFEAQGGEALIGDAAWKHLNDRAGPTMTVFLRRYVREPIDTLLAAMPDGALPELKLSMPGNDRIVISIGSEEYPIERAPPEEQVQEEA